MKLGIVGLPNVGKSTLFNAITQAGAECANYPFCTIEPNVGNVAVPDERLAKLAALYDSKKIIPATVEFVDIAGLVRGASKGEGLGNKFLSHIREVDAVVHVVRTFEDGNVAHVEGGVDPARDIGIIELELILADLESLQKRFDKAKNMQKTGDRKYAEEAALCEKLLAHLSQEKPARTLALSDDEKEAVKGFFLITAKPVLYAANIAEADVGKPPETLSGVARVLDIAKQEGAAVIALSCKLEEELAVLSAEDKMAFMEDLGIAESGLNKLVKASYDLLGLFSYLTAGEKETRAWTIEKGTKAPQAAGKIHSDFEKGFIRADIVDYDVLLACGSYNAAKEKGKVRSEGKEYVLRDGDVVLFKFNV